MEPLKHECGVALVRLLKPLAYYQEKYGTWRYGLNKLYLMMEKQHNRGQEGAGLACVKMNAPAGEEYIYRERAIGNTAIQEIFGTVAKKLNGISAEQEADAAYAEKHLPYAGEIYMGHLRYSTTGRAGLAYIHPFLRRHSWPARNLCVCGNFNITNVDEVFEHLTSQGQHPRYNADTYLLLEQLGHRLDRENDRIYKEGVAKGYEGKELSKYIESNIDIAKVFKESSPLWDGGFVICAITGSGDTIAMRDPWGIRPAFWYKDEDQVVVASERPVIQTSFNVNVDKVNELKPGQAIIVNKKGEVRFEQIIEPKRYAACSFERIYFSRGSDTDIYKERKALGAGLQDQILKAVDGDLDHTVFSFIPNTAESAFYGMMEGFNEYLNKKKTEQIEALGHNPRHEELLEILNHRVCQEKVAWKDIKMRTFIAEGNSRNDLVAHVYDVTYGSVRPNVDNLVIIDDSIVRGTTLRESIIRILDRLEPKKIVICSSAPQIRYPDYYGIDMPSLQEFIAFRAAMGLLDDTGKRYVISETYRKCKEQLLLPNGQMQNCVKDIYAPFTDEDISCKMADMLKAKDVNAGISIVFQTIDGLHKACPNSPGDWYFSGDYPTPGGVKRVNQAFVDYFENIYLKQKK